MATYSFEKYTKKELYEYRESPTWVQQGSLSYSAASLFVNHYFDYEYDAITNTYTLLNPFDWRGFQKGDVLYSSDSGKKVFNSGDFRKTVIDGPLHMSYGYPNYLYRKKLSDATKVFVGYVKGDFVGSVIGIEDEYPINGEQGDFWYVRGELLNNEPTIAINTLNNATLFENDTLLVNGTAKDTDKSDIVNVYYQINTTATQPIQTRISDGASPVPFSEQLTFKGGKLYLPDGTALTGALAEGIAHKLKVWAEDNKGGKSTVAERTFYVVPNRPPKLTINPFDSISDLINADKVTFTGSTSDPDSNEVVVSYKLNNGLATEVYRGKDGEWSFDLLLSTLKDGENTIVVETVDSYNFKTSLTRKINKQANLTPLAKSVQRYTIVPPAGSAQGVLMWIERDATQSITAEISMTNGTEQEQFKPMTLDSSGPANVGTVEDFFKFRANAPAEKIAIKLSWTGDKPIFKVSGALTQ